MGRHFVQANMTNLTDLENTVLQMMLNGDHPVLKYLRPQLELCHVEKRKFTGTGFYTELYVNLNTVVLPKLSIAFGDIAAEVSGLQYGAGFMLFVEGGLLDVLEGYCYGETWPEQGAKFNLSYMPSNSGVINAEARNWKSLNKVLDEALKKA